MVSPFTFLPEFSTDKVEPETAPRVALGAASPLWLMFGGAAAAGAAYWWWASRWREAINLEALMALAPEPVAPAPEAEAVLGAAPEPIVEAVADPFFTAPPETVEVAEVAAEAVLEPIDATVAAHAEVPYEEVSAVEEGVAEAPELAASSGAAPDSEPVGQTPALDGIPEAREEAAAETVEAAVETVGDDLTRLVGVGPKLATSLAELGVTRFSQIAAWSPDDLASIDQLLNLKGRAERDAWIAQAKRFAATAEG